MRGIQKWLSIIVLAAVVGLGTPAAVRAQGSTETPAVRATATVEVGDVVVSIDGSTETPGFLSLVKIYLSVVL